MSFLKYDRKTSQGKGEQFDAYRESTGIPRRINRICDGCLMYASQQGKRLTDEHQVRYVLEHEMLGGDV